MDVNLLTKEQIIEIYRKETGNNDCYIRPLYARKYDTFAGSQVLQFFNQLPNQDGCLSIVNYQVLSTSDNSTDEHFHEVQLQQPDYTGGISTLTHLIRTSVINQLTTNNLVFVFNGEFYHKTTSLIGGTNSVEVILSGFRLTPR